MQRSSQLSASLTLIELRQHSSTERPDRGPRMASLGLMSSKASSSAPGSLGESGGDPAGHQKTPTGRSKLMRCGLAVSVGLEDDISKLRCSKYAGYSVCLWAVLHRMVVGARFYHVQIDSGS